MKNSKNRKSVNGKGRKKGEKKYKLRYAKLALHQAEIEKVSEHNEEGKKFFSFLRKNKKQGLTKEEKSEYQDLETKLKMKRLKAESAVEA